jgi:hypothetical protein
MAPVIDNHPRYVLLVERGAHRGRAKELAALVEAHLVRLNEEYAAKSNSGRLLPVETREVPVGTWNALRHGKTNGRGNFEQYKHSCLVSDLDFARHMGAARREPAFAPHSPSLRWGSAACAGSAPEPVSAV